jgi:hypothetical protein
VTYEVRYIYIDTYIYTYAQIYIHIKYTITYLSTYHAYMHYVLINTRRMHANTHTHIHTYTHTHTIHARKHTHTHIHTQMSFEITNTTFYADMKWTQKLKVIPGPPHEACVVAPASGEVKVMVGKRVKDKIVFVLYDKNRDDKKSKSKGNLCPLTEQFKNFKDIKIEAYDVRLIGEGKVSTAGMVLC